VKYVGGGVFADGLYSVSMSGKAGPDVSSGSAFGGGWTANTIEEGIESVKRRAREHADWLISYRNPETEEVYKIERKVITKLTINGVKHYIDTKGLDGFFN
jgi:hypothetical protein